MVGILHHHQLLRLVGLLVHRFRVVARMCPVARHQQQRPVVFVQVVHQVEREEGHRRGGRPGAVRIDRTRVVATRRLVVVEEAVDEFRHSFRQLAFLREQRRAGHHVALVVKAQLVPARSKGTVLRILPALLADVVHQFFPLFRRVVVLISLAHAARHVVHGRHRHRLDARVRRSRRDAHASQPADGQHTDPLAVHEGLQAQIVHRGAEILGKDVGRSHIPHLAATLTGKGRIEGQRHEAAFGHLLRVQAAGLLLHGTKRATQHQRRQFALCTFRHVKVAHHRDAVAVAELHLLVLHLAALREGLVPLLCHFHSLNSFHRFHADVGHGRHAERGGQGGGHQGGFEELPFHHDRTCVSEGGARGTHCHRANRTGAPGSVPRPRMAPSCAPARLHAGARARVRPVVR